MGERLKLRSWNDDGLAITNDLFLGSALGIEVRCLGLGWEAWEFEGC